MKIIHTSFTLPNRMKAITLPLKGTDAVSVFVYCKVGSRHETKAINGASHFLEHLMFKGTKRRPSTLVLSQELESLGAEFNAFTSKDHTGYYIKAAKEHFPQMLDILSDMLFHSTFAPEEIERERTVIIQEIKMYEENPLMHIEDMLEQTVFAGSALGRSIAGPAETIAAVSRKQLLQYKDAHYTPENMLVVVAGNITSSAKNYIQKYFGGYPRQKSTLATFQSAKFRRGQFDAQVKKNEQTQLGIAYPGFSYIDPRIDALEVMSAILGGSMSSRLFINVRERLGLCYYIKSDVVPYEGTGICTLNTGVSSSKIQEAIKAIMHEVHRMRTSNVTKEELVRAKEYLKGKLILRMEESDKVAQWFGQEALFMKRITTPQGYQKVIDRVTVDQIRRVAQTVLRPEQLTAAAIGPITKPRLTALFRRHKK